MVQTMTPTTTVSRGLAGERILRYTATFFAVAVLLHNADHLRRGRDAVSVDVFGLGSAAIVLEVAVVVVVFMGHRLAPLASVAAGFALAAGYVFVHFTPARSWLSDSFVSGDVSALSWGAAILEAVAAATLGAAGLYVLARQRDAVAQPLGRQRTVGEALGHPVVAAMFFGNLVILALSLAVG